MNQIEITTINPLDIFTKIESRHRITFGDMQRIRREIGETGIGSRDQAERLIALAKRAGRLDRGFADWLVAAMVDYVVWSERPTGVVTEDDARWLGSILTDARGRASSDTATRILREIALEAQAFEGEALTIFASATRASSASRRSQTVTTALAA